MKDFARWVNSLGTLHDVWIDRMTWRCEQRVLEFHLDDIHSNFLGLPEYPGCEPGTLVFSGVSEVSLHVEPYDDMWIYELTCDGTDRNRMDIMLNGGRHISCRFDNAEFRSDLEADVG